MIDWFRSLFCKHQWKFVKKGSLISRRYYGDKSEVKGHFEDYMCFYVLEN